MDVTLTYGPYDASGAVFSVPVVLQERAFGSGLVQVLARLEVKDPGTGEWTGARRTEPAYVSGMGTATERWLDEATARAEALAGLPIALPPDTVLDGPIGLRVSP